MSVPPFSEAQEAAWENHKAECYARWREKTISDLVDSIMQMPSREERGKALLGAMKISKQIGHAVRERVTRRFGLQQTRRSLR